MAKLKVIRKKNGGRDASGKVTVRHHGGEHKRYIRVIDFKRDKRNIQGRVIGIEYDPNRTCDVALVQYSDGEKRYILSPEGLQVDAMIVAGEDVDIKVGNALPLSLIPIGTFVHNVELTAGKGGQLARSAGTAAIVQARENNLIHLKLPSSEIRRVHAKGYATIGQLGNVEWKNRFIGSAGNNIHRGIRPTVRGVAQNPRSHAHGGGEGRSGIGMKIPKTYAGRPALGKRRKKNKYSNKNILQRRKHRV